MMYGILFIGLGSIGKRHIRNVLSILSTRGDRCEIDVVRSGHGGTLDSDLLSAINKVYSYDDNLASKYDAVFITNPTSMHYSTLQQYSDVGANYFIEKPIFSCADCSLTDLHIQREVNYYVACPLRYNSVLQYVKNNIDCSKVISVRSVSSSYLPDWRPGTDYRSTYSAHKDMGGGVSIDLIHEWDYLSWLFGMPTKVFSLIDRVSDLEIDSDDLALYMGQNANTVFELHLDYFGRQTIRQLQMFMPNDTAIADIAGGTVTFLKEGRTIALQEERNAFQLREIEHFIDIVDGKCQSDNTVDEAVKILRLAKGVI